MGPNLIAFVAEIIASLMTSGLVLFLLQPALKDILVELCGSESRAAFWGRFARLMIFISPLIVVVLLTRNTGQVTPVFAESLRATLLHALLGQFAGLAVIGLVILRFSWHAGESGAPAAGGGTRRTAD